MRVEKQREDGISNFDERELHDKMLRDKYNAIVFHEGKGFPLYLVGGYLRDALLHRDSLDRDFVAGGEYGSLLERVAMKTDGRLVRIGDVLGRIVLRDNSTLDFTPLTSNIVSDLSRRDFTINSIAWSPATGIIDPHGGIGDLRKRTIRIVSRRNLNQDPIRLIRAYRFASELSFRIDPGTSRIIREMSGIITNSKSERITLEFFKILNLDTSSKALYRMLNDGLLNHLIPITGAELRGTLRVLSRVERIFNVLPLKYRDMLHEIYSQGLSRKGLIRLEVLLGDVTIAKRLSLSRKISKNVKIISEGERLFPAGRWTHRTLFEAFALMGDASIDFLIVKGRHKLLVEYERYNSIIKNGILSTEEIIRESGLSEGIILGDLIMSLRRAEFEKRIGNREEALSLVKALQQGNLT